MRIPSSYALLGASIYIGVVACSEAEPQRYSVYYRTGSPSDGGRASGGAAGSGGSVTAGGAASGGVAGAGGATPSGDAGVITVSCRCPDLGPLTPCCTPTGRCGSVVGAFCFPLFEDSGLGGGTGGHGNVDAGRSTGGALGVGGSDAASDAQGAGGRDGATEDTGVSSGGGATDAARPDSGDGA